MTQTDVCSAPWNYTDTGNAFCLMSDEALGSERGQSRCRLYADEAAAVGAERIAIHARGAFSLRSLDNGKQERGRTCCHHPSPQRLGDVSKG